MQIDKDGYYLIMKCGHPMARKNGLILVHRLVMAESMGRNLSPLEVVHHINGEKTDNRIENLELFSTAGQHTKKKHPEIAEKNKHFNLGRPSPKKGRIFVERTPEYLEQVRINKRAAVKRWNKRNPDKVKKYRRTKYLRHGF